MAGRGACGSCLRETKYTCLKCKAHCCVMCAENESDEETTGWQAGKSVGYCESCSMRLLDDVAIKQSETSSRGNVDKLSENCSRQEGERFLTKLKRLKELANDNALSDDDIINDRKSKQKKKPGRKSSWSPQMIDDFIDIIVNNDYYQKKLVFTNTKNQKNGEIYPKILIELKERATDRCEETEFTVPQLRSKFKKCVSVCKQAALTVKTATGIERFQEERGFGKWFNALFALVKSRDSCKLQLALEPSSVEKQQLDEKIENGEDSGKKGIFVPVKKKQRKASDKLGESAIEAINVVKETLKNDSTKDLIAFMKDEMEKSREHELQLVGLMQSFRQNNAPYLPPQQLQPVVGMPYDGSSSAASTSYPTWNIAIGSHSQPAAYHNTDVFHHDGEKSYQKL